MKSGGAGFFFVSCALLLACHPAPEPTPELERPTLERGTAKVKTPAAGAIITIPKAALAKRAGVPGVFVYRDGRARFQMVKSGRTVGDRIEILSGLHGGEAVVLGDLESVYDGSPLRPGK